jgi:hypothetical protein
MSVKQVGSSSGFCPFHIWSGTLEHHYGCVKFILFMKTKYTYFKYSFAWYTQAVCDFEGKNDGLAMKYLSFTPLGHLLLSKATDDIALRLAQSPQELITGNRRLLLTE